MASTFVQGLDYGPRKGTLGLEFHMSEGGDGLVSFLSRHAGEELDHWRKRVRGVSCHAAILSDRIVQMVDLDDASGNADPDDRSTEKGFYGHSVLVDVLGEHWVDPNAWSISAEIAGFAKDGPTDQQVGLAIAWAKDMKARFPSLRGAWGHADQTDTKGCPGTTPNMKAIFAGIGGHGRWEDEVAQAPITDEAQAVEIEVAAGTDWFDLDNATKLFDGAATVLGRRPSPYGVGTRRAIFVTLGGVRRLVLVTPSQIFLPAPALAAGAPAVKTAVNGALDRIAASVDHERIP